MSYIHVLNRQNLNFALPGSINNFNLTFKFLINFTIINVIK